MEPKSDTMALESPKLGKKQIETTYRNNYLYLIAILYI